MRRGVVVFVHCFFLCLCCFFNLMSLVVLTGVWCPMGGGGGGGVLLPHCHSQSYSWSDYMAVCVAVVTN